MAHDRPTDDAPGFFARNRVRRLVIGVLGTGILVIAYLFGIQSYRAGITQSMPHQDPQGRSVSVVLVPTTISASDQTLPAQLLLFPGPSLLDADGLLTEELEVRLQPAVSGQTILFPAGEPTAPQSVVLPAPGVVQEYPFDNYQVSVGLQVHSLFADSYDPLPTQASIFFRVPGWSLADAQRSAQGANGLDLTGVIVRDGSTKSIALLLLLLMVILAVIAILVTGASTRGRLRLDLTVASWMTALLFALIPIRGFFPGAPPLGSWMDVLVFFWVELILMLSVAAVVTTILLRASYTRHHPEEIR